MIYYSTVLFEGPKSSRHLQDPKQVDLNSSLLNEYLRDTYTKDLASSECHSKYLFLDFYWEARVAVEHTEDNVRR